MHVSTSSKLSAEAACFISLSASFAACTFDLPITDGSADGPIIDGGAGEYRDDDGGTTGPDDADDADAGDGSDGRGTTGPVNPGEYACGAAAFVPSTVKPNARAVSWDVG